jgi:hypothetical protein
MKFKLNPTKQLALLLAILAFLASAFSFSGAVLLHLAVTLGFALILYWFYSTFTSKRKDIWNTVITALIIFLLLHYGTSFSDIIYPLIAVFIAITMKFFVEHRGSPIINPSVAGLLLMAAIAALIPGMDDAFISWWGASFRGYLSLSLLLIWLVVGVHKWRKLPIVASFLLAHAVILMFRGEGIEFIQYTFTNSTIFFLSAVMLIDPKTSPMKNRQQFLFGLVAAIAYNVFIQYGVPYSGLFAIVTANLSYFLMKPRFKKKS